MTDLHFLDNENTNITVSFNIDDRMYLFKDMIKRVDIDDEHAGFAMTVDLESTDRPRWYDLISLLSNYQSDCTIDLRVYARGVRGPMVRRVLENTPICYIYCEENALVIEAKHAWCVALRDSIKCDNQIKEE